MFEWLRWLPAILVTYRIALLFAEDEGPFGIFRRIRARLGGYDYGPEGQPLTLWGRGSRCALCVGMYVAIVVVAGIVQPRTVFDFLMAWMGVAGGQAFLHRVSR